MLGMGASATKQGECMTATAHEVWQLLPVLKPRRSLLEPETRTGDAGCLWARMMISDDMALPQAQDESETQRKEWKETEWKETDDGDDSQEEAEPEAKPKGSLPIHGESLVRDHAALVIAAHGADIRYLRDQEKNRLVTYK